MRRSTRRVASSRTCSSTMWASSSEGSASKMTTSSRRVRESGLEVPPPTPLKAPPLGRSSLSEAVEELGLEARPHDAHDGLPLGLLVHERVDEELAAEVAGHDEDDVAEVDGAALTVGEPAVVEHLQQDVEGLRVRLLDLVQEHD